MICEFCGHTNEPGAHLCARCGAELEPGQKGKQHQEHQTYQQAPNRPGPEEYESARPRRVSAGALKTAMPSKKILLIAVPAVVVIIAIIIVASMLGGLSAAMRKNHIEMFKAGAEIIVSGNNNEKFTIKGGYRSSQTNLDGSKAVVLTDYSSRSGGVLWFVTPTGATRIADDVFAYLLADSGNGVAYFTGYDEKNNEATLNLYDTSGKRAAPVADNAFYIGGETMPGVAISPNGKSVGYITDYDERNYEFTGYVKIAGKSPEKIGNEMFAVAISDGGRYLYFQKFDVKTGEASLHVRSGRNEHRLAPDASNIAIMLNSDYSEILISVYDGDRRTFISRKGGERQRISGVAIHSLVMPRGAQIRTVSNELANTTIYGKSSFTDFVAITDEGLAYYNKNLEATRIAGSTNNANSAKISNDGKTLYFINNSNWLSSIDPSVPGAERKEIVRNVKSFVISDDGKSVYFVENENELYHVSGNRTQVLIAEDVEPDSLTMSYRGNRLFFLMDYRSNRGGELHFSNNGGRRTKVSGADDVMHIRSTPANIFYTSRHDELFRSNGNEKFTQFHEKVEW